MSNEVVSHLNLKKQTERKLLVIHLLAQSDKPSTATVIFAILWVLTTGGFIATVLVHLNRKKYSYPMIDGGKVEIRGPTNDRLPTEEECDKYLNQVADELASNNQQPGKFYDRKLRLPNGTTIAIRTADGSSPTTDQLRYYLWLAEQMIDLLDRKRRDGSSKPKDTTAKQDSSDLPEAFRSPSNSPHPPTRNSMENSNEI